jgi:hypothetical protein
MRLAFHFSYIRDKGPYYVLHFKRVVEAAFAAPFFEAFFCQHDRQLVQTVSSLPLDVLKVYVRLYNRRHAWFRLSDMAYPEVSR